MTTAFLTVLVALTFSQDPASKPKQDSYDAMNARGEHTMGFFADCDDASFLAEVRWRRDSGGGERRKGHKQPRPHSDAPWPRRPRFSEW